MNLYTSSPFNTVINETNNPLSSFSSSSHIWHQPVPVQGDFNLPLVHAPSQSVTPTVPQDHVAQSYAPLFPRPSIYVCQQHCGQFSVQGDTGPEVHIFPQHLASAAVSQRQFAQLNASMPPQPPHHVRQDTCPVQGDPSPLHVPVSPIQTKTPTHQNRYTCPYCKRKFKRSQELNRHLLSNLPDSIHCSFPLCPWTGHRQYSLMKHMKVHPNPDPGREHGRKEFQIYDAEKLVQSMASGTLTVECAADIALSKVKKRFEEQDKADVDVNVWGNRRKFCAARSWS